MVVIIALSSISSVKCHSSPPSRGTSEKVVDLPESVQAPAEEGGEAGRARYYLEGVEIGSVPILYGKTVEKASFADYMKKALPPSQTF